MPFLFLLLPFLYVTDAQASVRCEILKPGADDFMKREYTRVCDDAVGFWMPYGWEASYAQWRGTTLDLRLKRWENQYDEESSRSLRTMAEGLCSMETFDDLVLVVEGDQNYRDRIDLKCSN